MKVWKWAIYVLKVSVANRFHLACVESWQKQNRFINSGQVKIIAMGQDKINWTFPFKVKI